MRPSLWHWQTVWCIYICIYIYTESPPKVGPYTAILAIPPPLKVRQSMPDVASRHIHEWVTAPSWNEFCQRDPMLESCHSNMQHFVMAILMALLIGKIGDANQTHAPTKSAPILFLHRGAQWASSIFVLLRHHPLRPTSVHTHTNMLCIYIYIYIHTYKKIYIYVYAQMPTLLRHWPIRPTSVYTDTNMLHKYIWKMNVHSVKKSV